MSSTITTETTPKKKAARRTVPAVAPVEAGTSPALASLVGDLPSGPREVPVDHLYPHPHNPRRDVGDIGELADSIREHGIRQQLLAVPDPGDPDRYRIVIGHRRHAAALAAGLVTVPVVVDPTLTEADQLELMLVENVQRSDLTVVEEADGYQGLLDLGVTVEQAATRTGRSTATVRRRLRLVDLPEVARTAVHEHRATLEDALRIPDRETDPEGHDLLAAALGTSSFGYRAAEVERKHEVADRKRKLTELIDERGIQTVASGSEVPDGHRLYRAISGPGEVPDTADATWCLVDYDSYAMLYRPPTPEETAATVTHGADRQAQDAEREARAARIAAAREFAETTATVRGEFLRKTIAIKKLTKQAVDALVEFTALAATTDLGVMLTGADALDDIAPWFGVDLAQVAEQSEADGADDPMDAQDVAYAEALASTPAPQRLLAALAADVEPITAYGWTTADRDDSAVRPWYALLVALGYVPSTVETDALDGVLPGGDG